MVSLRSSGIDVGIQDIEIDERGLFGYRGQRILIYIKDTRQTAQVLLHEKQNSRRFHFKECKTIVDMREANLFQRYVAIARDDGLFPVIAQELDGMHHDLEAPLGPCKYCLSELNYHGYADRGVKGRDQIWSAFSIPAFFAEYSSTIAVLPQDQALVTEPDNYTADWPEISKRARERARWRCSRCAVDCGSDKNLLQVHHLNGIKRDNTAANLMVLCLLCHAAQPQHQNMHVRPADVRRLLELKGAQGLL